MPQPDPIIEKYFELIEKNIPGVFKFKYYGDPMRIPTSALPAIIGQRKMTRVRPGSELGGSSEDEHHMELTFTVVTDVRKDFGDDPESVPGWNRLFDIVEGRDTSSATLDLKTTSLLYVLRHNIAVTGNMWTDVKTSTTVDYGVRANRQPGSWSLEAVITTTATLVQTR